MATCRGRRVTALGLSSLFLWASAAHANEPCYDVNYTLTGDWGSVQMRVAAADDPQERAQGLMFVEQMPRFAGMLFEFETPQRASFWMKNTLIPLDMIFLDEHDVVIGVHENAIPGDLTPIAPYEGVSAVLEVNGGLTEALGIEAGTQLIEGERISDNTAKCGS